MKRVTRNGVIAVVAASGAMAVTGPVSAAFAGDGATAAGSTAGSPGVISGNNVQLPVDVPVNVCGNTVNAIGLLNPAAGNRCANDSGAGSPAQAPGGATAQGSGKDSPGVVSGNGVQVPVHVPVNVSGNTANVVGIGNPATGNTSTNTSGDRPVTPPVVRPASPPQVEAATRPRPRPAESNPTASLAHNGADGTMQTLAASAALALGGAALYRRFRPRPSR